MPVSVFLPENTGRNSYQVTFQFAAVPFCKNLLHPGVVHSEPVAHYLVAFADELDVAVFYAVMHHLYKMTGAAGTYPAAAGRSVRGLGGDALEYGFYKRPGFRRTAGHHRRAFERSFFASGYSAAHIHDAFSFQKSSSAGGILKVRIASVYYYVSTIEQRNQLPYHLIYGLPCRDHQEDLARNLQGSHEFPV